MTDPNVPNGQPEDPNREVPPAPPTPPTPPTAPPAPEAQQGAPVPPPAPPQYAAPQQGAPYGQQPGNPYAQPYAAAPAQKSPVLSIISLIAGIVGLLVSIFGGWGFIFSVGAIVLGFLGKSKEAQAKGMWLTGIILGFVGIALSIIWLIIFILLIAASASLSTYSY